MDPFTFAPTQWLPTSVCTEYAKSTGVEPARRLMTSPAGVNTNTSVGAKIDLELVEEFARVFRFFLPVDHLAQPGDLTIERGIGLRTFFLIAPVPQRRRIRSCGAFLRYEFALRVDGQRGR